MFWDVSKELDNPVRLLRRTVLVGNSNIGHCVSKRFHVELQDKVNGVTSMNQLLVQFGSKQVHEVLFSQQGYKRRQQTITHHFSVAVAPSFSSIDGLCFDFFWRGKDSTPLGGASSHANKPCYMACDEPQCQVQGWGATWCYCFQEIPTNSDVFSTPGWWKSQPTGMYKTILDCLG